MTMVNMLEAKSSLSRLVQAVESGHEPEIVISRNGRPAAKLVPITHDRSEKRIGVAKGLFRIPDNTSGSLTTSMPRTPRSKPSSRGTENLEYSAGHSHRALGH